METTIASRLTRHLQTNVPKAEFFVFKQKWKEDLVVALPERHEKETRKFLPASYNGVNVTVLVIPPILDDYRPSVPEKVLE